MLQTLLEKGERAFDIAQATKDISAFISHKEGLGWEPLVLTAASDAAYLSELRRELHSRMSPQDRALFPLRIHDDGGSGLCCKLSIHPPSLPF